MDLENCLSQTHTAILLFLNNNVQVMSYIPFQHDSYCMPLTVGLQVQVHVL